MVNYTQVNDFTHLISADDHSHSTQLELTYSAGGSYFDEKGKEGESHLLEHCLITRSKAKSTRQLNNHFDSRGINRNAMTNPVIMSLEIGGHRDFNQLMIDTLLQMAYDPAFDIRSFEQEHKIVLREASQEYDVPSYRGHRDILNKIFIPGSISLCENLGNPCSVSSLTLEDMRFRYSRVMQDSHIILQAIGGGIDKDLLIDKLKTLGESNKGGAVPIDIQPKNTYHNGSVVSIVHPVAIDGCSLAFNIPFPITRDNRVQRWALSDLLYDRVYQTLRNELGLIYGVGMSQSINDQIYSLRMDCGVQHVERIVSELFKIVLTTQNKINTKNINHIKRKYIRQQEINSDSLTGNAKTMTTNLLDFGIPDSYDDFLSQLQTLTAESVMGLYGQVLQSVQQTKIIGVSNNPVLDQVMNRVEKAFLK